MTLTIQLEGPVGPSTLQLKDSFRFLHEPLRIEESAVPYLGTDEPVEKLVHRCVHSAGGAFLVTGFRGVGKSTIVARALDHIDMEAPSEDQRPLRVLLNLARPQSVGSILYDAIRTLYEAMDDLSLLDRLPVRVFDELQLAYSRTSLAI